jgi:nucleotide-binding universal stress UspA family protein
LPTRRARADLYQLDAYLSIYLNAPPPSIGYAHEHRFDLVVVGHHRNRRLGRFLLHRLAERMSARADMPVLVVSDDRDG